MYDVLYVLGTIAFFVLMLAYVAGCDRLGRSPDTGPSPGEDRP
jgi:hypothetical protein